VQNRKMIFVAVIAALAVAAAGYYGGHSAAMREVNSGAAAKGTPASARTTSAGVAVGAVPAANGKSATPASTQRMLTSAASNGSASAPLPAPGAPLKDTFADLKARADAGDAAAATRLFQDLQHCAEAQRLGQFLPAMANRALNANADSADAAQRNDRQLGMVQRRLDFQQSSAALCADVTPEQMAALVPTTLQAAQLGDAQAADCYVGANLNTWPDVLNNPDWINDYKNNALSLANASLQQGDWAMVGMMAAANAGSIRSNNMLNQVTGTNIQQAYTYAKLMSLGQPTGTPPSPRSTNALTTLSGQLSADQISAADAQAQQMFQQYFNATPRQTGQVANAMRSCQAGF
jgi:hypothetical protein